MDGAKVSAEQFSIQVQEKLDYLCRILDQKMWQPEYSKMFKAREFCINSIEEYEERAKEIEELKKPQAQEEKAAESMFSCFQPTVQRRRYIEYKGIICNFWIRK